MQEVANAHLVYEVLEGVVVTVYELCFGQILGQSEHRI